MILCYSNFEIIFILDILKRACGSVVERFSDKEEVEGSIPSTPTYD